LPGGNAVLMALAAGRMIRWQPSIFDAQRQRTGSERAGLPLRGCPDVAHSPESH
jgi:hypothetical protein